MAENLMLLPKSKKSIKISSASLELFRLNAEYKAYEEKYKQRKKELQDIIKTAGTNEFAVHGKDGNIKVRYIESNKIVWDIEKLKNKIGKNINKVLIKKYSISDFTGLIEYLKSCGVNPKKFKTFISVEEKIDNKKIDELGQLGEINEEDLKGCYTLEKVSEYVKFTELEEMEE